MERSLNLTEACDQLSTLVEEVSEKDNRIIITIRNEPKAIIMGYDAYLQQQEQSAQGAKYRLAEVLEEAEGLMERTIEGCRESGDPLLHMFWSHMGRLMHEAWRIYKDVSKPHSAIAFQLFELSERYLIGDIMLAIEPLGPVSEVLKKLAKSKLTMEDAAEMDHYLLQHGIDARYPLYIDADLNALYEVDEVDEVGEIQIEEGKDNSE